MKKEIYETGTDVDSKTGSAGAEIMHDVDTPRRRSVRGACAIAPFYWASPIVSAVLLPNHAVASENISACTPVTLPLDPITIPYTNPGVATTHKITSHDVTLPDPANRCGQKICQAVIVAERKNLGDAHELLLGVYVNDDSRVLYFHWNYVDPDSSWSHEFHSEGVTDVRECHGHTFELVAATTDTVRAIASNSVARL